MTRSAGTALFSVILLLLGGTIVACREEPPETKERLRPVRTIVLEDAPTRHTRIFSGVSKAGVEVKLSFRVGGSIEYLPIEIGDRVEKGDVVARLDPAEYRIRVGEAEAAVAQARASERNAEANYDRVRRLYENNNASLSDLDAARAAYESADAQVRAARQRLALARQQLGYTTLRAPADGVIADVYVESDENVTPGETIAEFHDGARPEVEIAVPESFVGDFDVGETGTVTFDAVPNETFRAEVTEVAPSAVRRAIFPVTLAILGPAAGVRPGLAAEVEMKLETHARTGADGLLVPPVAVTEDRHGKFAFVVSPSHDEPGVGVVQRRDVEVGDIEPDGLVVTDGLNPGDRLVVAGMSYLEDGERVRLTEARADTDDESQDARE